MADVGDESAMRLRSRSEMKLLLHGLTPSKAHNDRIRAYGTLSGLLEKIGSLPINLQNDLQTLWRIIQQDITSSHDEIAEHALKVLCVILRLAKLTDSVAGSFLKTLITLITTTSRQRIFYLGMWCISKQELSRPVLIAHLEALVEAIVRGIDSPHDSLKTTSVSFQALSLLSKQLPQEMHELSASWCPPVYRKLMNLKTCTLAEKCLSDAVSVILPSTPALTEAVVTDMQLKLLVKMKSMVKGEEREALCAIPALSWLIRLLGKRFLQEKALINETLQILETSFTSPSSQVRYASQVAWLPFIDAFVPAQGEAAPGEKLGVEKAPSGKDNSFHKRLKLLMTPLVTTMRWETVTTVQHNCFLTWRYLLSRLGDTINQNLEYDTTVSPMLETVFKTGPKKIDPSVWAAYVDVYKCICLRNANPVLKGEYISESPSLHIPKAPFKEMREQSVDEARSKTQIQFSPWRLDRLESLVKILKLLWVHGLAETDEAGAQNPSDPAHKGCKLLDVSFECWGLLVTGVKAEETTSVRPSTEHVTAVHLLLNFFSWACKRRPSPGSLAAVWQLAETLTEVLQPVILTSSFYKAQVPLEDLARQMSERLPADSGPLEQSLVMVNPVVYISAVWFDLILRSESGGDYNLCGTVTRLTTSARSGFDVLGTFHGFALILDCLSKGLSDAEAPDPHAMKSESRKKNWASLLNVWRIVADQLRDHIERAGDVPSVDLGGGASEYRVPWTLLLYPIKFFLCLSFKDTGTGKSEDGKTRASEGVSGASEPQFLSVEKTWLRLYESVSGVSSCKPSSLNAFVGGLFNKIMKILEHVFQEKTEVNPQFLRFLGDIVIHALEHAEVPNFAMLAISRKRRKTCFGTSSVRIQYLAGIEAEESTHLRDLLVLASWLLRCTHEACISEGRYFTDLDIVCRLLPTLNGIFQQTTSQNDALRLLEVFSQPFKQWLAVGAEGGGKEKNFVKDSNALQEALSQAWDGLLSCLQACHPGLKFDQALLDIQAPTLSLALVHDYTPIAEKTLSFWDATYGSSKGNTLKYPSCLVEVINKLQQQKVQLSLPGWSSGNETIKQKFAVAVYSRHPLARFMPRQAGPEQNVCPSSKEENHSQDLVPSALDSAVLPKVKAACNTKEEVSNSRQGHLEDNRSDGLQTVEISTRVEGGDYLVARADMLTGESSPEANSSLEDYMSIVDSALKKFPEGDSPSPDNVAFVNESASLSGLGMDGERQVSDTVSPETFKSSERPEGFTAVEESRLLPVTASKQDVITGRGAESTLITPPVASVDIPLSPPNILAAGERDERIAAAIEAISQASNAGSLTSVPPRPKKKLEFQDAADALGTHQPEETAAVTLIDTGAAEVRDLQRTQLTLEASFPAEGTEGCDNSVPPGDATEPNDEGCNKDAVHAVPRDSDGGIPHCVVKQTEAAEPRSGCSGGGTSSAPVSKKYRKVEFLIRPMKERLAGLVRQNPYLTFREFVRSEQLYFYKGSIPTKALINLKKYLNDLKMRAFPDHMNAAHSDEEEAAAARPRTADSDKENSRPTEDALKGTHPHEEDQLLRDADAGAGATSPAEQENEMSQLSMDDNPTLLYRNGVYGENHSRHPRLRRALDVIAPSPTAVALRSSGKLRGGKHRRVDPNIARGCVLHPNSKNAGSRRPRRSININSVPGREERAESACRTKKTLVANIVTRAKSHVKLPLVNPAPSKEVVAFPAEYLEYDSNSSFRIRDLSPGLFDKSKTATELQNLAVQAAARSPRLNHPRKSRFPKRLDPSPCNGDHHNIMAPSAEHLLIEESLHPRPVSDSAAELLVATASPTDGVTGAPQGESPQALVQPNPLSEGKGCEDVDDGTVTRSETDLNGQIQSLLQGKGVRMHHILGALAAAPGWDSLSEREARDAEKHLSRILATLSQRKVGDESPKFSTPPTHFSSSTSLDV
ncbi:hypothetical protein R1sor_019220 [Riccia sorocarpa]|uniref:Telomere-associated protein Rif1 N-terminal domain-containing protein n=1 Tax=Riccia sorocarpa TaxID=122646 RepID=A0ABD3IBW8_9MARC